MQKKKIPSYAYFRINFFIEVLRKDAIKEISFEWDNRIEKFLNALVGVSLL